MPILNIQQPSSPSFSPSEKKRAAEYYLFLVGLIAAAATVIAGLYLGGVPINGLTSQDALLTTISCGAIVLFSFLGYCYLRKQPSLLKRPAPQEEGQTRSHAKAITPEGLPKEANAKEGNETDTDGLFTVEEGDVSEGCRQLKGKFKDRTLTPWALLTTLHKELNRTLLLDSPKGMETFFACAESTTVKRAFSPLRHFENPKGHCLYGVLSHVSEKDEETFCSTLDTEFSKPGSCPEKSFQEVFKAFEGAVIYKRNAKDYYILTTADYQALRVKVTPDSDGNIAPTPLKNEDEDQILSMMKIPAFLANGGKDFIILGNWHLIFSQKDIEKTLRDHAKKTPKEVLTILMSKIPLAKYPANDLYIALAKFPLTRA